MRFQDLSRLHEEMEDHSVSVKVKQMVPHTMSR